MTPQFSDLAQQAISRQAPCRDDLQTLLAAQGDAYDDALYCANRVRRHFKGDRVLSCSIISAKQGRCSEDCRFCSQSVRHNTDVATFPLVDEAEIQRAGEQAEQVGAHSLGIVISGRGLRTKDETDRVVSAVRRLHMRGRLGVCASLGLLTDELARRLRDAGLERYHHNLETSRRFFPSVCTTHTYDDRLATLHVARDAGLQLCSGGLFGLGETDDDRIDLAFELRELGVASVPLNFLNPIKGTPLEGAPPLPPRTVLKIIAMFRFVLPDRDIKVCGGREANLRDLQSWMFYAGANGAMVGNYLTTTGRAPEEDLRMIDDLGLSLASEG